MKVVIIGGQFPSDTDYLKELANLVDVTIYGRCVRLRKEATDPAEAPEECPSRTLRPLVLTPRGPKPWIYRGLKSALDQDAPEVIHVIGEPWRLVSVQVAVWARHHPQTAFVVHAADRNWWGVSPVERAMRRYFARRTLPRVDAYVALNTEAVCTAERFGLAPATVTAVIHTEPRDPALFRPPKDESERAETRRALGLPVAGSGVGFIGKFIPRKGPLFFLDAIREGRPQFPEDTWMAIAGGGPQEPEVARRARAQNVKLLGNLSFPDQVARFYRAIDVLVVPSRPLEPEEQGPRAAIEAMLSACVVVATRVGALPEMLDQVGILSERDDPRSLADGIVQALNDPDGDLGRNARRWAIERYSGSAVARALVDVWSDAIERRQSTYAGH